MLNSDDSPTTLAYQIVANLGAGQGTVVNNGNGTFTFNPGGDFQDLAAGETRNVSFTYKANDGTADSNVATVTVVVTGKNDAPVAEAVAIGALQDGPAVIGAFDADDVDSDDDPTSLSYQIVTDLGAGQGTVINNGNGTFTFNPGGDFQDLGLGETRDVSFTYKANDGAADSNVATVTVAMTGRNQAPTANPDQFIILKDGGPQTVDPRGNDVEGRPARMARRWRSPASLSPSWCSTMPGRTRLACWCAAATRSYTNRRRDSRGL